MFSSKNNQYKRAKKLFKDVDIHPFWEDGIVIPYDIEKISPCYRLFNRLYHTRQELTEEVILNIFRDVYGFVISQKRFEEFLDICKENNTENIRSICAGFRPVNTLYPTMLPYDDDLFERKINKAISVLNIFSKNEKRIKKVNKKLYSICCPFVLI